MDFPRFHISQDILRRAALTALVLIGGSVVLFLTIGGMATVQPDSVGWPRLNQPAQKQFQDRLEGLPWPDWQEQGERMQGLAINEADSAALQVYYFLDPTCPTCMHQDRQAMAQLLEGPVERGEVQLMVLPVFQKGLSRDGLLLYRRLICTARQEQARTTRQAWEELFFGSRDGFLSQSRACETNENVNQLIRWQSEVADVLQLQAGEWMLEQGRLPRDWKEAQKLIEAAIQQRQSAQGGNPQESG